MLKVIWSETIGKEEAYRRCPGLETIIAKVAELGAAEYPVVSCDVDAPLSGEFKNSGARTALLEQVVQNHDRMKQLRINLDHYSHRGEPIEVPAPVWLVSKSVSGDEPGTLNEITVRRAIFDGRDGWCIAIGRERNFVKASIAMNDMETACNQGYLDLLLAHEEVIQHVRFLVSLEDILEAGDVVNVIQSDSEQAIQTVPELLLLSPLDDDAIVF